MTTPFKTAQERADELVAAIKEIATAAHEVIEEGVAKQKAILSKLNEIVPPEKSPFSLGDFVKYVEGCSMCEAVKKNGGFGPDHYGSRLCRSGSLRSGGRESHCTCGSCFD